MWLSHINLTFEEKQKTNYSCIEQKPLFCAIPLAEASSTGHIHLPSASKLSPVSEVRMFRARLPVHSPPQAKHPHCFQYLKRLDSERSKSQVQSPHAPRLNSLSGRAEFSSGIKGCRYTPLPAFFAGCSFVRVPCWGFSLQYHELAPVWFPTPPVDCVFYSALFPQCLRSYLT